MRFLQKILLLTILTLVAVISSGARAQASEWYLGIWEGWTIQTNPSLQYTTVVSLVYGGNDTIVGTTAYPELRCGGTLKLVSESNNKLELREKITYGGCIENGIVEFTFTGSGKAEFYWYSDSHPAIATSTLSQITSDSSEVPQPYTGVWEGTGVQVSPSTSWSILITLTKGGLDEPVGTIAYPSLRCGGKLTLLSSNDNKLTFHEKITYGGRCVDNGTVVLKLDPDDSLKFEWYYSSGRFSAEGSLSRVSSRETRRPTELKLGQRTTGQLALGEYRDYFLETQEGGPLRVEIAVPEEAAIVWAYSRFGAMPEWNHYDIRQQERTVTGTIELLIPATENGTYYFTLYGRNITLGGTDYSIRAIRANYYLSSMAPTSGGNTGNVTLHLSGVPFVDGMAVQLRSSGKPTLIPEHMALASATNLWAKFDLKGKPIGSYTVHAIWPNGTEATLAQRFEIVPGAASPLSVTVDAPQAVRPGREYVLLVSYANKGSVDLPVSLLRLVAKNASVRLADLKGPGKDSVQFFTYPTVGPVDVLPPGATGQERFVFVAGDGNKATFDVHTLTPVTKSSNIDELFSVIPEITGTRALAGNGVASGKRCEAELIDNTRFIAREMFFEPEIATFTQSSGYPLDDYTNLDAAGQKISPSRFFWEASLVRRHVIEEQKIAGKDFNLNPKLLISLIYALSASYDLSAEAVTAAETAPASLLRLPNMQSLTEELTLAYIHYHAILEGTEQCRAADRALADVLPNFVGEATAAQLLATGDGSLRHAYQTLFGQDLRTPLQEKPLEPDEMPEFILPYEFDSNLYLRQLFSHDRKVGTVIGTDNPRLIFTSGLGLSYDGDQVITDGDDEPHRGHDILGNLDTQLLAVADGKWYKIKDKPRAELAIDLNDDDVVDFRVRYEHNSSYEPDGYVYQGDPVAKMGKEGTGTEHLHLEVIRADDEGNSQLLDPFGWWSIQPDPAPGNCFPVSGLSTDCGDEAVESEQRNTWFWKLNGKVCEGSNCYFHCDEDDACFHTFSNSGTLATTNSNQGDTARHATGRVVTDVAAACHTWAYKGAGNPLKWATWGLPTDSHEHAIYELKAYLPAPPVNKLWTGKATYQIYLYRNGELWFPSPLERVNCNEGNSPNYNPESPVPYAIVADQSSVTNGWLSLDRIGIDPNTKVLIVLTNLVDEAGREVAFDAVRLELVQHTTGPSIGTGETVVIRPIDPNEKSGPAGTGEQRLVFVDSVMDYTVYFENLPAATAAAQEVFIEDQLDPNLDWKTLQFEEVAFGDVIIPVTTNDFEFTGRETVEDFRTDVDRTWWVEVSGRLDPVTGRILWTLRTIDPDTGALPDDPFAGFLPPEDGTGRGQGHLRYSIRVKEDVKPGISIVNKASIVFDTNEPIETNEVSNVVGRNFHLPIVVHIQ